MSAFIVFMASILNGLGVSIFCAVLAAIVFFVYVKYWKSRQLLNSLPGLFTSLGLLGTFCAICNSLGDIQEDNLNVTTIIQNLIPAFTSSIAGLVSAFIATLVTRGIYAHEDSEIDNRIQKITPEECLYRLSIASDEMIKRQERQSENLKNIYLQLKDQEDKNAEYQERLNTTIGEQSKILEKFIEDFVKRMDDIFSKMHGQIEQNIKDFGEKQFHKCAETIEGLTTQLASLTTGILQAQESSVKTMVLDTNSSLSTISEGLTTRITELCSQMSVALSNVTDKQNEKFEAMYNSYENLATRLASQNNEFAEKINEKVDKEYAIIQEHNAQSLQQMSNLGDSFAEVNKNMLDNTLELNREVTTALHDNLSTFIQDLNDGLSANLEQLRRSYDYISDHVANIKGNYESAVNAYSDAVNNAHRFNESQENMIGTIEASMQKVVSTNEKVDMMVEVLKNKQDHVNTLIANINEIDTAIISLQNLEKQLNRIAAK